VDAKRIKRIIIGIFWVICFAFGNYYLSVIIYFTTARHGLLIPTVLNFAVILFWLVFETVEIRIGNKLKVKYENNEKKPGIFVRILIGYFGDISFKTSLYLFYVFILVCVAIAAVQPGYFSESFEQYLISVEYGILVLVAADNFINHFLKDVSA